ncbi:MAG: hypothetical protein L6Q37_09515 [Bdellovibrionaceae bacterium]|nr:hypothetical protein [Pseudobdellovibrionaceae bacterium]NUM60359.1 hypothetical protein [Pseudobdellovibrionaceae bacterium]
MAQSFLFDDEEQRVYYLNKKERENSRLSFSKGRVYSADGKPVDTKGYKYSYVIDKNGQFYLFNYLIKGKGKINHSSFLAGGEVAGAGEMIIHDGILKLITNASGHYSPELPFLTQAIELLQKENVDLTTVTAQSHQGIPYKINKLPNWTREELKNLELFNIKVDLTNISQFSTLDQIKIIKSSIENDSLFEDAIKSWFEIGSPAIFRPYPNLLFSNDHLFKFLSSFYKIFSSSNPPKWNLEYDEDLLQLVFLRAFNSNNIDLVSTAVKYMVYLPSNKDSFSKYINDIPIEKLGISGLERVAYFVTVKPIDLSKKNKLFFRLINLIEKNKSFHSDPNSILIFDYANKHLRENYSASDKEATELNIILRRLFKIFKEAATSSENIVFKHRFNQLQEF